MGGRGGSRCCGYRGSRVLEIVVAVVMVADGDEVVWVVVVGEEVVVTLGEGSLSSVWFLFLHLPCLAHIGARFFGVRHGVGWGELGVVEVLMVMLVWEPDVDVGGVGVSVIVVDVVVEASLRFWRAKYFENAAGASSSIVVDSRVVGGLCEGKPAYSSLLVWMLRVSTKGWRSGWSGPRWCRM